MTNVPKLISGESYFAKVYDAVADFNEKQTPGTGKYQWEINLAVDEDIFQALKDAGANCGLKEAGTQKYTDKPVITFLKWATDFKGNDNIPPTVVDIDKNPLTSEDRIENGSQVRVQWNLYEYGNTTRYKRPMLIAVQVVKMSEHMTAPEPEVADWDEVPF